jgi:hypothetical protein
LEPEGQESKARGALYVDGFNLYYPIKNSGEEHLKWACLWTLGELICKQHDLRLVTSVLCTAVPHHLPDQRDRHNRFNAAQVARGVTLLKGHHVPEPDRGGYSEKQSDINVALSLIMDGLDDVYDTAFLLSADSDQVATATFFKSRLVPMGKELIAAIPFTKTCPPGYAALGFEAIEVPKLLIEASVMPAQVQGKSGHPVHRPREYDPPVGWVHPSDRPKGSPPKAPKKWGPTHKSRK